MTTVAQADTIKTLTTHYIDGAFVESHGREVMDVIKPTNGKVIARVTLGDEEDTRRAIAAAKRAFSRARQPYRCIPGEQCGHTAFEDNDPEITQPARFSERCTGESFPAR